MSDTIEIKIRSQFDGGGTATARKEIEGLVAAVKAAGQGKAPDPGYGQVAAQARTAAQAVAGLSQAEMQAARAAEQLAQAQNRTAQTAAAAAAAQTRAETAALRYAAAQDKAAQSGARASGLAGQFATGVKDGISGMIGPIALAGTALHGLEAIAGGVKEGLNLAATLDEQHRSIGILLGDVQKGNSVFQQAAAFGQKYGFTQKEMGDAASAAAPLIRSSTTAVEKQLEVLGRLASLNPNEGFSGATFSTKELASGDITSIVERFNIARNAANKMKQEIASGKDVFQVLDAQLNSMGVGIDVLSNRMDGTAGAVRGANIAMESLKVTAGQAIAPTVELAANGLERIIRAASGSQQAVDEMRASLTGQSVAQVQAADALATYIDAVTVAGTGSGQTRDELQALGERMAAIASDGAGAKAGVDALVDGLYNGTTATADLGGQLDQLANQQQYVAAAASEDAVMLAQAAQATNDHTSASAVNSQALVDQTQKSLDATAQAQQLAQFQQSLATLGGAVANGLSTAGQAALSLANQYHIAYGEALNLINAQAALAQAKNAAAALADQRAGERSPGTSGAAEAAAQEERRLQAIYRRLQDAPVTATKRGGVGRANAAAAAGQKLENIEQKTGDKLADIDKATQQKLAAIDKKAADDRIAAQKRLSQAMAQSAASRRADNEADDLDLIGVKDEKEAAKLNDRERAQAASREREKAAAAEAREAMAAGGAETAEKVYAAREEQIQKQQALDEAYYAKQRELAGDPAAQEALKQQYDEATRAINEATQLQIDFAHAAADEKAAAAQAEKDAVVAAAEEQKNAVIGKAQESAAGIKNATASAKAQAVADLQAIGAAVDAIPSNKTVTVSVNSSGGGGTPSAGASGRSDGAYAGGGDFVTNGPTTITVGDNPGGREFVSVIPLSGTGTTRPVAGGYAMAGGGTVDAGDGYTTPIAGQGGTAKKKGKGSSKGGSSDAAADIKDKIEEQRNLIQLLSDMLALRADMAREVESGTPFNVGFARALAKRAAEFAQFVRAALPAATKDEAEGYKRAAENSRDGIAVLSDLIQLRKDMSDYKDVNPFDVAFVERLTAVGKRIVQMVQSQLVPTTQAEVDRMQRWADLNGSVVSLIKDVSSLNAQMFADYVPPSDAQLNAIARDANRIAQRLAAIARTYDTKGLDAAKQFVDAVGGTFTAFKDGLLFFQALNSGDFVLNPGNLAKFEKSTMQTMAVAARLGAMARKIPSQDLAALQLTTQALAGQAEALIKLAAVPFADLPAAARALQLQSNTLLGGARGAGGGGGGSVVFNIYQQPGQDARQLANEALRLFRQDIGKRR